MTTSEERKEHRRAYLRAYSKKHRSRDRAKQKVRRKRYFDRMSPEKLEAVNAKSRARTKAWRDRFPEKTQKCVIEGRILIRSLKDKPCQDCGIKFHSCAMQFDHARGKKLFNMAGSHMRARKAVLEEALKCDVVCANCHFVRTWKRTHGIPLSAPISESPCQT